MDARLARNPVGNANKGRINGCPFVCLIAPFVGNKDTVIRPFVVFFRPSVGTDKFFSGFTLVELMVTLAIVAILGLMAAPAMTGIIKNHRITTEVNGLVAELSFARTEAIKRGTNVGVCSRSGTSVTTCAAGPFTGGWLVFVDSNANTTLDAGEIILKVHEPLPGTDMSLNVIAPGSATIVFDGRGASATGDSTYALCDKRGKDYGRGIRVLPSGQVRVADRPDSCS